jgi:hypothetical protein
LDEFETLFREKAYLAAAMGVSVEICSADQAREDPKGKSNNSHINIAFIESNETTSQYAKEIEG